MANVMRYFVGLLAGLSFGCTPGEFTDEEKRDLQRELNRRYGGDDDADEAAEAGAPSPDDDAPPDSTEAGSDDDEGSSDDDGAEDSRIDPCVLQVFENSCSGAGCHYGGPINSSPDLERNNLFEFLTTEGPLLCSSATTNFVDLDSPMESYLLLKIRGDQPANCGVQMPSGAQLSPDEVECLEDWFASLQ